ncbi:MAG TPA: hypothetical protein VJS92_00620 [Candidatus Polarisedimenticolaceae bacterium]|nr:hypothetical protein [Candidatus Polarisedimenticolaceae bacterium]
MHQRLLSADGRLEDSTVPLDNAELIDVQVLQRNAVILLLSGNELWVWDGARTRRVDPLVLWIRHRDPFVYYASCDPAHGIACSPCSVKRLDGRLDVLQLWQSSTQLAQDAIPYGERDVLLDVWGNGTRELIVVSPQHPRKQPRALWSGPAR